MSAYSIKRRCDVETLDRDNPFITPSPHAPWAPLSIPRPRPVDRTRELFEIALLVWGVIVALALFAFAMA
jgi:hypothetical protein